MQKVDVVIVGAGFSGLACGAALNELGVQNFLILDKGKTCGNLWNGGLNNLTMHTPWHGNPFDYDKAYKKYPMFKRKDEVVRYLSEYSELHNLGEKTITNCTVNKITDENSNEYKWTIDSSSGKILAKYVIIATGFCASPYIPVIPLHNEFKGKLVHSYNISNCEDFAGKRVLVVGNGNSAIEAVAELHSAGATEIEILAGAPRYYVSKRTFEMYYNFLIFISNISYTVKRSLGILNTNNKLSYSSSEVVRDYYSYDDVAFELHTNEFLTKKWCDNQLITDRITMFLSEDLSSYGLPFCPPLVFGESANERFHVIDGVGFIDKLKSSKNIKVLTGRILNMHSSGAVLSCLMNDAAVSSGNKSKSSAVMWNTEMTKDNQAQYLKVERDYDAVIFATGFRHGLDDMIWGFERFVRPPGQNEIDLSEARKSYIASRNTKKSIEELENGGILKHSPPSTPVRTNHSSEREKMPWVKESSQSVVDPSLFFVGFDRRRSSLTLGYQGWDAGVKVAQLLGKSCDVIPRGFSSLPSQRELRLSNLRRKESISSVLEKSVFDYSSSVYACVGAGIILLRQFGKFH